MVVAGALGALSIPIVIWIATGRREKKRLTIQLINNITTLSGVVDRQERLYLYRKYEELPEEERAKKNIKNPYDNITESLLFDSAIYLNFMEAACFEIEKKAVYRKPLYETADAVIVGVKEIVLNRYVKLTGIDPKKHYPYLLKVVCRLKKWNKDNLPQTYIPDSQE